jgi:Protein of unknown function (DUF3225)
MTADDINLAHVIAEVTDVFHRYETALMTNDLTSLDDFFWDSPSVTRYGIGDRQWGIEELRHFRANTPPPQFTRYLEHLRINAFGSDVAIAQVEFVRSDTPLRGFQTQTWIKFGGDWKIVSAHVSMIPFQA